MKKLIMLGVILSGITSIHAEQYIVLLNGWFHVGDSYKYGLPGGDYPDGEFWEGSFELNSPQQVTLTLSSVDAGGINPLPELFVNDSFFAYLPDNQPDYLTPIESNYTIPSSFLSTGINTIRVNAVGGSNGTLDEIGIGNIHVLIPEPASLAIMMLGGIALLKRTIIPNFGKH